GSMQLLADRDPEEARTILDPVLERMMEAVHRYEGTVNQVMGEGLSAPFGAPLAHEDHAVRACYAALRMQDAVRRYAVEVQRAQAVPIHIRVGINSGEVVVRSIGSDLRMYGLHGCRTDDAPRGADGADGDARDGPVHGGGTSAGRRLCPGEGGRFRTHQGTGTPRRGLRGDWERPGPVAPAGVRRARPHAVRRARCRARRPAPGARASPGRPGPGRRGRRGARGR